MVAYFAGKVPRDRRQRLRPDRNNLCHADSVNPGKLLPQKSLNCYRTAMNKLVCPHCDAEVSERAQVCRGCGAEIVRGATREERSAVGGVFAFLAFIIGLFAIGASHPPDPRSDGALFIVLGLLAFVVVAFLVGKVVARLFHRSKLRFLRSYEHQ